MTSPASRAGALAAIGLLSVLAPVIGTGVVVLFAVLGILVFILPQESRVFDRLATVPDHEHGRLRTLAGFALAIAVLALLGTVSSFELSAIVFAMSVVIVTFGPGGELLGRRAIGGDPGRVLGCTLGGASAGLVGYALLVTGGVETTIGPGAALLLAAVGALAAGLYRTELEGEDPLTVVAVGLLLWFFAGIGGNVSPEYAVLIVLVTVGLGVLSYVTATASIAGMLSGTLLALVTFAYGGFEWFVPLVAFFVIGGLATKFRYDEKAARGVAEGDEGSRGTANVMSNGFVPLVLVVGWATVRALDGDALPEEFFMLAFAGGVSTALADTLASEIGALYDAPRLITSFEEVTPGTDGAVTMQGHLAGLAGAGIIAGLVLLVFPEFDVLAAALIVVAGLLGMSADSILGATVEGVLVGNDGVNLLATTIGALIGGIGLVLL